MHLSAILWTLLAQLIVAIASAVMTVRLALRRYRQEKWWEKKYEAYAAILIVLHKMKKSYSDDFELAIFRRDQTPQQKERSQRLFTEAAEEIASLSDLADFIFSEESCAIINAFRRDIDKVSDGGYLEEYLDTSAEVSSKALDALKPAAKRDLNITQPTVFRATVDQFLSRLKSTLSPAA